MALKLIKKIEGGDNYPIGEDLPLGTYLRVIPSLNPNYDTIYYELYESQSLRTDFKVNKFNDAFHKIVFTSEFVGETLRDRVKNEIPKNQTPLVDTIATLFYEELRKLAKFNDENWENC